MVVVDVIKKLKNEVIEDYEKYLEGMYVGKYPSLEPIKLKIIFIEEYPSLKNKYKILDYILSSYE